MFKVTGETNTDDLSPAPDAWSRPDIPLHALAMLKLGEIREELAGSDSFSCFLASCFSHPTRNSLFSRQKYVCWISTFASMIFFILEDTSPSHAQHCLQLPCQDGLSIFGDH